VTYAIISLGGKQYRVQEGERLLVERLPYDAGKTFHPDLLLVGGEGDAKLGASELRGQQVTAKVAEHVLGKKIVVGKHKRRTGYRRRNGHRSRLTRIEIQSIGAKTARSQAAKKSAADKAPKSGTTRTRKTTPKKEEK
jgi:large subunit ribosomal protein L21